MKTRFSLCKKTLAAACAVILLLTSLTVAPVAAAPLKGGQTFGYISEYKNFRDTYQEAVDKAAKDFYNLENSSDLSSYQIPVENVRTLYTTIVHTHPELFYLSSNYSYSYYRQDGQSYIYSLNTC